MWNNNCHRVTAQLQLISIIIIIIIIIINYLSKDYVFDTPAVAIF
jgi:hypothetical protein